MSQKRLIVYQSLKTEQLLTFISTINTTPESIESLQILVILFFKGQLFVRAQLIRA